MSQTNHRRLFLKNLGMTALLSPLATTIAEASNHQPQTTKSTSNLPTAKVQTPGIAKLPYTLDGNTKVFHLNAEPVTIYFQDMSDPNGLKRRPIYAWGYNGSVTGPTIEAVEGDHVRIVVTNRLPEPTSVHWHGLHVPIEMDGVTGISQEPIAPGESFEYEFTLEQHGTYFYHPHFMSAKQVGMGMCGFFIIHPKNPEPWQIVDHDFAFFLQTWKIHPGTAVPDTLEMNDSNYFTLNGKPAPDVPSLKVKSGDKVRLRFANLSLMTHPIHLHGHSYFVTDYGAGFVPQHQHLLMNTNSISSGEARAFDFTAGKPGKWVLHCHFLHHVMNDMHRTPIPGRGGHDGHEMGGMFTYIEVLP